MPGQIFRVGSDIYDATSGKKIPNEQVLQRDYTGATEVPNPSNPKIDTRTAGSTPIVRPGQYGLTDWRSYQSLKDAANAIINMKNNSNSDLTPTSAYWKSLIKDTSPFGGTRDSNQPGAFTDARLRELSPSDQASIRATRESAARGGEQALNDELQYREKTAGDTLSNVRDMYNLQVQNSNNEEDQKIRRAQLALDQYNAGMPTGGNGTPGKGIITDPTGNAYDITSYASDPNHEKNVANILSGIPQLKTVADIDNYLYSKAHTTPLTGQMIADAASKYGVSWEAMIAIMQQDSSLGTRGLALKTLNPGNVGNNDRGNTNTFNSWQDGVDAVAKWLSGHKATSSMASGVKNNNETPSGMKQIALETGIDLSEIPAMTNQQIIDARRQVTQNANTGLASTAEGKRIQATYGITSSEIDEVLKSYSAGVLSAAQIKAILKSEGVNESAYDDIINMAAPTAKGTESNPFSTIKS